MKYRVLFGARAKNDVLALFDYIAEQSSAERAAKYLARLDRWCAKLSTFPKRGIARNDIRVGLRIAGFERRVSIAFVVGEETVHVLRILYGGRDISVIDFPKEA